MTAGLLATCLITISFLALTGCVGPMPYRQAKLPDGAEIRVYHAGAALAPSITIVAFRANGSTNWTLPNTFSGPGLIASGSTGGGIAAAGALLRPSNSSSSASTGSTVNNVAPVNPASKPVSIKPPKYHE